MNICNKHPRSVDRCYICNIKLCTECNINSTTKLTHPYKLLCQTCINKYGRERYVIEIARRTQIIIKHNSTK